MRTRAAAKPKQQTQAGGAGRREARETVKAAMPEHAKHKGISVPLDVPTMTLNALQSTAVWNGRLVPSLIMTGTQPAAMASYTRRLVDVSPRKWRQYLARQGKRRKGQGIDDQEAKGKGAMSGKKGARCPWHTHVLRLLELLGVLLDLEVVSGALHDLAVARLLVHPVRDRPIRVRDKLEVLRRLYGRKARDSRAQLKSSAAHDAATPVNFSLLSKRVRSGHQCRNSQVTKTCFPLLLLFA